MKNKFLTVKIHVIGWVLLLLAPYFSTRQVYRSILPDQNIYSNIALLALCFVLISVFYLNYFVLINRFLFKKKYWQYFVLLILSVAFAFSVSGGILSFSDYHPRQLAEMSPLIKNIQPIIKVNGLLMLIISIVTSTLLAVNMRLKESEAENFSAQIASLKSQINPHFLFNTLHNIYAIAIDTSPKAADMVDKLSEMMRYTMRDTQKDFVLLEDEVNYVNNYIELQKVRLDRRVQLEYRVEGDFETLQIAPMLLMPFIENAFKHGVTTEQRSEIKISIRLENDGLRLEVVNRKVDLQTETSESSGLGIENTKRRLELLYPSKHLLTITETPRDFKVLLHIDFG